MPTQLLTFVGLHFKTASFEVNKKKESRVDFKCSLDKYYIILDQFPWVFTHFSLFSPVSQKLEYLLLYGQKLVQYFL